MLQSSTDVRLVDQLLRIAREPELRSLVYAKLGDYCHQCRNRLNSLKLSLYLAMKQATPEGVEAWREVDRHYQELERRVEQIQALCRPITLSRVTLRLDLLIEDRREAWTRLMADQGRDLEFVAPAEGAVASFDVERLGKALDSLVAWRAREHSDDGLARIRWWAEAGYAHITWEEVGSPGGTVRTFESEESSTWSLPILARVIEAHGGELHWQDTRGWRLDASWPMLSVEN